MPISHRAPILAGLIVATFYCGAPGEVLAQAAEPLTPPRAGQALQPPQRPFRGGRGAGPIPAGVVAHRDLAYVTGGHTRQKLDLYLPAEAFGPLPLIVWVHGGGWQNGSKENCLPLRSGFVQQGYAVASLGYRLSSDAVFPAQIEDCKAAIRYLRAHADKYGLDRRRFAAWGSSAGGHLVALLGTSGDVSDFDVGENLDQSSRVQAVCNWFGPTDFNVFVKTPGYQQHGEAGSPEAKLLGGRVADKPAQARAANPITYISADDPPFLIMHGSNDRVVPPNQSELLDAALRKAGVESRLHSIRGAGHGGAEFSAPEVRRMIDEFFQRHLRSAGRD